eukprot:Awhi_evm1s8925
MIATDKHQQSFLEYNRNRIQPIVLEKRRMVLDFVPHTFNTFSAKVNAHHNVKLQHLTFDSKSSRIFFHISVKDICFHKKVTIRYTTDQWETAQNVDAKYLSKDSRSPQWNIFLCSISLSQEDSNIVNSLSQTDLENMVIEFALSYQYTDVNQNRVTEWENNN